MRIHLLLVVTLIITARVSAIYFTIEEGARRCFIEQVPEDMLVVGKYKNLDWFTLKHATPDTPGSISITVHDPTVHKTLALSHETVEQGQFAFTSANSGEHSICITANTSSLYGNAKIYRFQLLIEFGDVATDYSQIAKAEHLSAIEVEIRKLNDKIKQIRAEQNYQKQREAEFRDTSETINARLAIWSIVQTGILVAAGLFQLYMLQRFFKSKKLA